MLAATHAAVLPPGIFEHAQDTQQQPTKGKTLKEFAHDNNATSDGTAATAD